MLTDADRIRDDHVDQVAYSNRRRSLTKREATMFFLTDEQWDLIKFYLPQNLLIENLDTRRKISGIIHVGLTGCLWPDCPTAYGAHSTVYGCFRRWRHRKFWKDIINSFEQNGWAAEASALDATQVLHTRPFQKGRRIDRAWRPSFQKN